MEKIKIGKQAKEPHVSTFVGQDGATVYVKHCLPYEEKERFAIEWATLTFAVNEETSVVYIAYNQDLVKTFLTVKYYTNIDVSDYDKNDRWHEVYDYVLFNGLLDDINTVVQKDMDLIQSIYYRMYSVMDETERVANSLSHKIKKSFSSILTDEDITETLAKSEIINEKMIDMLGVFRSHEKEQTMLQAGKQDKSKVRIGGALVNMAKK